MNPTEHLRRLWANLLQQPWAADQGAFPMAEAWVSQGLSLPIFAGMSADQQDRVIAAVRHFFTA